MPHDAAETKQVASPLGLTIAQLSARLRCAECGGPLHSVKPWRMEDVPGKPLGRRGCLHATFNLLRFGGLYRRLTATTCAFRLCSPALDQVPSYSLHRALATAVAPAVFAFDPGALAQ